MKRFLSILLAITLVFCLSACDEKSSSEISSDKNGDTSNTDKKTSNSSTMLLDINNITIDQLENIVITQSNRHNLNAFCYDNSWIYGAWGGKTGKGELVKVRYDNSDWTVIDNDTNTYLATCQAIKNGYIYYSQATETAYELIKVRSSGEESKVIIKEHQGSIQLVDNYIYYTTKETFDESINGVTQDSSHLYRCDLNGENVEVILEKPVYYFSVFGDYILYQDDKDNMTLHIYDTKQKKDTRINDQRSFFPIFDGEYVYYISDSESDEEFKHKLYKIKPDGSMNTQIDLGCYLMGIIMRGDYIYYINLDDNSRIYRCLKDGSEVELITQDSNVEKMQWVNNSLAYTVLNDEGQITNVFICDIDGGDKVDFYESDDYWNLS